MKELKENLNKYQPPRDLELFCYALISIDVKGNKRKAQELSKVDKGKFYYAYKTSEEFRHWFSELCFSILAQNEAIPPHALLGAISNRDVQAIRTYYELIGKLKSKIEHSGRVEGDGNKFIIQIIDRKEDVINEHTSGKPRITQELAGLERPEL